MDAKIIEAALRETLVDGKLSRSESQALKGLLDDQKLDVREIGVVRATAFRLAAEWGKTRPMDEVLGWLEGVLSLFEPKAAAQKIDHAAEVYFSPGEECLERIATFIRDARASLDICVFTITDDRISRAIGDAHFRRVKVRLITDDEKSQDLGSDIDRLAKAGVPVAFDSEGHMHHKFVVADAGRLLTGSYNWTRGAAEVNHENVLVTSEPRLVQPFILEFDRLWGRFLRG